MDNFACKVYDTLVSLSLRREKTGFNNLMKIFIKYQGRELPDKLKSIYAEIATREQSAQRVQENIHSLIKACDQIVFKSKSNEMFGYTFFKPEETLTNDTVIRRLKDYFDRNQSSLLMTTQGKMRK